jgi:hypothetical protein
MGFITVMIILEVVASIAVDCKVKPKTIKQTFEMICNVHIFLTNK